MNFVIFGALRLDVLQERVARIVIYVCVAGFLVEGSMINALISKFSTLDICSCCTLVGWCRGGLLAITSSCEGRR